jgi:hypothetical protein
MKYLGLAYFTPDKFAAMAPDDVKKLVSQCPALDDKMRATDKVLISASLGDPDNWRTLRPRSGKTHVTDGPYTESKEVVGGLFIIEADTHDEALHIASMHPAATLGEAVIDPLQTPSSLKSGRSWQASPNGRGA